MTLALVVLAAYLATSGYAALSLSRTERRPLSRLPTAYGLDYEDVSFPSRSDRLNLAGWLLWPAARLPVRRAVVLVHGRGQTRESEVGDRVLEVAADLVGQGRPVLLFDLRGWGQSEGDRFTMGAKEADDVGGAVDFMAERELASDGVDLLGFSMGAAAAMLLAPREPRVRALAEDAGYAVLTDVLREQLPLRSGLPGIFTPGTMLMARVVAGYDPEAVRPLDGMAALAGRGTALLVIHGTADTLVDPSHARRLAAAYGPRAETMFVEGAEHVGSYEADPAAYLGRLRGFFQRAD